MAQDIRNIKAGQKFLVIDMQINGFEIGCIIEALDNTTNVEIFAGRFKWIGGFKPAYYNKILGQNVQDLKRFKGKIKYGTSNN